MTDSHLLAGRFGAATRLSPKALRLYADQGLLAPARVDPETGYRWYAPEQVPRARTIARLRRLGLPLARVAQLVDLPPDALVVELRAWLHAQTERLADETELVDAIARQAGGGEPALIAAVGMRDAAASKVLYRQRHVRVTELDRFIDDADAEIRAQLRACGASGDDATSVHFEELITRDSEGLVLVAVAYEGGVEPAGDLRLRLRPARREVFLPVPAAYEEFPLVLRAYDAIEAWLDARGDLTVADSPYEIHPGSGGARFDVVYPVDL